MPTINWPANLPPAQRDSNGYTPRSLALPTSFGLIDRSRQIYSGGPADFTVTFAFTDAQWWYFEGFWLHELKAGTQYFRLPVIVAGVLEEREVSFNGTTWQALLAGVSHGRLTATLVTRKGTAMDADTWAVLQEYGTPAALAAFCAAFNHFVEVEIPAPTFAIEE